MTLKKQTMDKLRESEEKYRTILESIQEGYYEVDLEGRFTFFNASLCRIFGYSSDEMSRMSNQDTMKKEDVKSLYETSREVYNTGKPAV